MTTNIKSTTFFGLVWWNANDYFHFRPEELKRKGNSRWPQSRQEYLEKCKRVDGALTELFTLVGIPKVLALGEVTRQAATELRDRLLPGYRVLSLDVKADDPTLQVAALYAPDSDLIKFEEQPPLVVPRTPIATRPMAVLDAESDDHIIRIVICHWQARMDEKGSRKLRGRMADYLSGESYDFVRDRPGKHHLAIIGDFNEEPYEDSLDTLNAHRHRGRSQGKPHWADDDVKRVHLYNTAWRLLGEQQPHPQAELKNNPLLNCAGTYYWEDAKSWRNFDQLIVSGGLLGSIPPHIDEDEVTIISSAAFLSGGLPIKFSRKNGKFVGLSDHLPIHANVYV